MSSSAFSSDAAPAWSKLASGKSRAAWWTRPRDRADPVGGVVGVAADGRLQQQGAAAVGGHAVGARAGDVGHLIEVAEARREGARRPLRRPPGRSSARGCSRRPGPRGWRCSTSRSAAPESPTPAAEPLSSRVPVSEPAKSRPAINANQRTIVSFGRRADAPAARRTAPARPRGGVDRDRERANEFMRPS